MPSIFPPSGRRDDARWAAVAQDERDYSLFCLEFCSAILDRRPEHQEALESAAEHFTRLGYYADGLGLDERIVRIRPDDPGARYNIACSLALVGRRDDAIAALIFAAGRGYNNHAHMAQDEDLASLRSDHRFQAILRAMRGQGA